MSTTLNWSPAARSCWGKTDRDVGQSLSLVQHLDDAAAVMAELWVRQPRNITSLFIETFGSENAAKSFLCFAAGVHDVGKASSHFAFKAYAVGMPQLGDAMVSHGLAMPTAIPHPEPHGALGQAHLEDWLARRFDAEPLRCVRLGGIIGGHHGRNPSPGDLEAATHVLEGEAPAWRSVRDEILDTMANRTGAVDHLPQWLSFDIPVTIQVLTTALVIMADWIASDERLFPYGSPSPTAQRVSSALNHLRLPNPWQPSAPTSGVGEMFANRFPQLSSAHPNRMQAAVVEAALALDEPGLIVLEAPMGMGKTEAALMAAEILAERFGLGGVFVGLPTMATSNPMFSRVREWLDAVPAPAQTSITLAHSKAGLNDEYSGLMPWAHTRSVYDDEASVTHKALAEASAVVHSWFMGRKRGILANHVIGTIDQSLFAALKAKHVVLRHLGLASKVVIIDEVHAADDYMRTYLKRVLAWLGAYRTPVVLMSATLPPGQRQELIDAYRDGRGDEAVPITASTADYPLITTVGSGVTSVPVSLDSPTTQVSVEPLVDDLDTLARTVNELLSDGGCLGIIRNTVARAQETYQLLSSRLDCEVVLMHSRFLAPHRARRERDLVERLGRDGARRPEKIVVVGTQVLEQSLDIDFDGLITDLAPVDLVLQRIGRLHRHDRRRPSPLADARCFLTGVDDWSAEPPSFPRGSAYVYGPDALLRAAAVFLDRPEIALPVDIPALVARAYQARPDVPRAWAIAAKEAHKKALQERDQLLGKASTFLLGDPCTTSNLNSLIDGAALDPEDAQGYQQVRDSEDSLEVVVIIQDGQQYRLPDEVGDFSGRELPLFGPPENDIARAAAACTITLPHSLSGVWVIDRVIRELEAGVNVSNWQTSPWLKGQLVLALDESGAGYLAGHAIYYDLDMGLIVEATPKAS